MSTKIIQEVSQSSTRRLMNEYLVKYAALIKKHNIPKEHQGNLVLFVEDHLGEDDPFIEVIDRNKQLQKFAEEILMQDNEVLGKALQELLEDGEVAAVETTSNNAPVPI